MDQATQTTCELLIENRDRIKKVFHMDENITYMACSSVYTMKGKSVDTESMKACKALVKDRVGMFNYFRGASFSCIAAMLDASGKPEETLDGGLKVYKLLKEVFFTSEYLPFAAMSIAQLAQPSDFDRLAAKTRSIYNRMKAEHWFRTSAEDTGLCALLAVSDKPEEELIANAEECYAILKPSFFSGDAVQSLSHVLALSSTDPREACEKTMELYTRLKEAGHKYGTYYELATLGVLAMEAADFDAIVPEIVEIDGWLAKQKGFGIMSTVTKKQRLMYAGMIAVKGAEGMGAMQNTALTSMISMMVAQEVAVYSSLCATVAVTSAASGSSS